MTTGDPYPSTIVVLKKDERIAVLSDSLRASGGKDIYKVKFQQRAGWMQLILRQSNSICSTIPARLGKHN
jgi:hypothetical protein